MSTPCERAALVEAMFDGRLGPSEQASCERHLKTCPECADHLRELTSLRQALRTSSKTIAPLEHQRARLVLLRKAATPPSAPRRPVGRLAFALVTLPLAVWAASSTLSVLRARTEPLPTVTLTAAPSAPPSAPAPTNALPVSRPEPEKQAPSDRSAVPTSAPNAPSPALPTATLTGNAAPRGPVLAGTANAPPATAGSPTAPRRENERAGEKDAPTAPANPIASAPAAASNGGASREFAEAMDALSRGDFSAGAGKLDGFAAAHPSDPRAEEAAYLQAIALERAGRMAEAKAAARRYLASYPNGAHRAQARRLAGD